MYELIYFISSNIEEKEKMVLIGQVDAFISELGGKILSKKDLGERQLAYTVKKEKAVHSIIVYFDLNSEEFNKLKGKIKSLNEILRFQIFRSKSVIVEKLEETEKNKEDNELEEKPFKKDILDI